MGLFDLFRKKDDIQKEIEEIEKGHPSAKQKVCPGCGRNYSLETLSCPSCETGLYVENENFCMNPNCSRSIEKHQFSHDDFFCDKCNTPTVVGDLSGFND